MHRSTSPRVSRVPYAVLAGLLAGCGAQQMPVLEPGAPPPPAPGRPTPEQFAVASPAEAEPPPLVPLPSAPRRVAVFVRESLDGREPAEDVASEGIVANTILSVRPTVPVDVAHPAVPRLDVVSRQVYEKALARDMKALLLRKRELELDAEILKNLADSGCDLLAVGEVGSSSTDPAVVGKQVRELTRTCEASVLLVRLDDAVVLGTGTGSSRRAAPVEAKREALETAAGEAVRKYHERRDEPVTQVSLTIEGLRGEADAAAVEKALRSTRGIVWIKDPRFRLGPDGAKASTARFELGWNGKPEDLKQAIRDLKPGFRLSGTGFEGTRWTFRAEEEKEGEEP